MAGQMDGHDEAKLPFTILQMHLKRFQAKVRDKKNCSINYFRKLCLLSDNVEESFAAGQDTDDKMVHAYYMLNI
jgi:hypothetical protein